ncbi:uncharacterized protein L969DRAFT_89546 [Mixia osmundae IAM 14324]|uniref:Replication factor C subunit 2 n=1 Tax=Mixia osmundae (strain CBS 9802 / IAM 14324 / JCM 22182 / KY 12970) TaxID=764103 RepID=G7EA33_MIXOS|nr:uncharacterized protein L969DRAFT_89546 [Mixia osmundae IAM 14324]KEI37592.1 hypothetical protein L969DRAFT_89546 [Mixia osmundae IAM 14324]GAA99693.1 hypothetical protein E5Q_06396 [Mixia osmundae IAM 14324]
MDRFLVRKDGTAYTPPASKAGPSTPSKASASGSQSASKSPARGVRQSVSQSPTATRKPSKKVTAPQGPMNVAIIDKSNGAVERKRPVLAAQAQPWVEKYRPKTIDDISAQENTVRVLRKSLENANLPHMLFYGPPGTGKTSTILALAKQLFGPEAFRTRVLELNASDERGITVVREKIKNFAKIAISPAVGDYPCPPYKIIILDEADSMTQDAQSALRRIMENYSKITRFCLICNYVTRIIEPITSRCSKFRFKPLDTTNTQKRLEYVCQKEEVQCGEESVQALIRCSEGDLRRAITYLQSASRLYGKDKPVDPVSIQEIAGVVPDPVINSLARDLGVDVPESAAEAKAGEDNDLMQVDPKKPNKTGGFDAVNAAVTRVVRQGYSATQLLSQLHDVCIFNVLLSKRAKSAIAMALGEADKCLTDGADEHLQILNTCLRIRAAVSRG